jgi:hypothetical protein
MASGCCPAALVCLLLLACPLQGKPLGQVELPLMPLLSHTDFIAVPSHRLLLCKLNKVASQQFGALFNALRGSYAERGVPDKPLGEPTLPTLRRLLLDPTWHKAVFYREPLERFLSAFTSKCGGADVDGLAKCKHAFGPTVRGGGSRPYIPFTAAVAALATHEPQREKHFAPMARACGGLPGTLHLYSTVARLERESAHEQVGAMLKAVGYDITPASSVGKMLATTFPPRGVRPRMALTDPEYLRLRGGKRHITAAAAGVEHAYRGNSSMIGAVVRAYREDYELFRIPLPSWARGWQRGAADGQMRSQASLNDSELDAHALVWV